MEWSPQVVLLNPKPLNPKPYILNCSAQVVLLTCRSELTGALGLADIRTNQSEVLTECTEEARLHRYVIDVKTRAVVESIPLADFPSEFPCVNPAYVGLPTRFGYTAGRNRLLR